MWLLLLIVQLIIVSISLCPQGLQLTRLPWPSLAPGVCSNSCPLSRWCRPTISSSFILFLLYVCEVAQSCPTLCDPMGCSLSGSSVHGIFQARVLEWIAISFSRGSSRLRNRTQVSRIGGRRFTIWATREAWGHLQKILIWNVYDKYYNREKF